MFVIPSSVDNTDVFFQIVLGVFSFCAMRPPSLLSDKLAQDILI